jgi:hypothetical protein
VAKVHGGFPAMNTSARQSLVVAEQGARKARSNGERRTNTGIDEIAAQPKAEGWAGGKPRVFVAAENRLLREALSRMLAKGGNRGSVCDSKGASVRAQGADFTDRCVGRGNRIFTVRTGRCPRISSEKRFSGGRRRRRASGASGGGGLSRAHSARCFSSISRGRQPRFLPRACTSGWGSRAANSN